MGGQPAMRIVNHGPAPVRIVTPERVGARYVAPQLLEAGQAWTPTPEQPLVSVVAAFGVTCLEYVGLAPAVTTDPCPACDGEGCGQCRGTGKRPAMAPEAPPVEVARPGDAALVAELRAAWVERERCAKVLNGTASLPSGDSQDERLQAFERAGDRCMRALAALCETCQGGR